jgi:hypothetical protein
MIVLSARKSIVKSAVADTALFTTRVLHQLSYVCPVHYAKEYLLTTFTVRLYVSRTWVL